MSAEASKYRFGPYEVHTRTRELYKQGTRLKLRPQPFQVLQVLVERAGDLVGREELRRILWPAETYVDFERGLNTSIKELRRRLSDSASDPRYIETLPKLGYRLIVPVEAERPVPKGAAAQDPRPPIPERETGATAFPETKSRALPSPQPWLHWAGICIVFFTAIVGFWQWRHLQVRPQAASDRLMLAVLPFANLTGDAGQDYWTDGLTEEMIAQLGRLEPDHLGVIARTSIMHYKGRQERIGEVGRELNVQYVLEGSIRKESDDVRVTAQLIRVGDESHVWARQYSRQLTSLLVLQGEIAHEISDELLLTLGVQRRGPPLARPSLSEHYEVYDLYLKGLYFWNKRSIEGFRQAIGYFEQAIAKDPKNARSYAGLADCYALLGGYTDEPRAEYMIKARAAALRALEIDESLPEAHTALALIVQKYDRDWETADREFRRAIQLNPSYATAHHWYAEQLGYLGRFDEAFRESELARRLDPLSLIIAADNGVLLYYSRQHDRAIEQFRSVLEMDPQFSRAKMVVWAYAEKGMYAEALSMLEQAQGTFGDHPWFWSSLTHIAGRSGKRERARQALAKLKQLYRPQRTDPQTLVLAYLGMGDKEEAMAWLEKAYSQHSTSMATLKVDPLWDPLRGDPRFEDLMRRAGLAR